MFDRQQDKLALLNVTFGQGTSSAHEPGFLQLGLLTLATILDQRGYRVELRSDQYPDPEALLAWIRAERIKLVGFYTVNNSIDRVAALTHVIKDTAPEVVIVLGGPEATARAAELLEETAADIVVRGEGDLTLPEIVEQLEGRGTLRELRGITWRDGGEVIENPARPPVEDLDTIPVPDRSLASFVELQPQLTTARGCPYRCSYCSTPGVPYRTRGVAHVMREVDAILARRQEPVYLMFVNHTFSIRPRWVQELCRELGRRRAARPDLHWYAEGRANVLSKHPHLIAEMRDAGLVTLNLGRSIQGHWIDAEQLLATVRRCVEEEVLQISVTFLLGGPSESAETIAQTLELAKELVRLGPGRVEVITSFAHPLPGSPLGEEPGRFGLRPIGPALKLGATTLGDCLCETEALRQWELVAQKQRFDREVQQTAAKLALDLPRSLVDRLFAMAELGVVTFWRQLLSGNPAYSRYYTLRQRGVSKPIDELAPDVLLDWYPMRTDQEVRLTEEGVVLDRFEEDVKLDPLETRIFHLSAGKLKVSEIAELLGWEVDGLGRESALLRVLELYRALDAICGVVFSPV